QLFEILARVGVAAGGVADLIEHELGFDAWDRRDRRLGGREIAGRELRLCEQDARGVAILAADLRQLADRGLVIAGGELVAPGREVGVRDARERKKDQRDPHPLESVRPGYPCQTRT